jgi:hypothetical protein
MITANKIFAVFVASLVAVFLGTGKVAVGGQPIIKLEPEHINLGTHVTGKELIVTARIANNGSKAVTIQKIKTSCGCSKAEPEAWEIRPKSSVKLDITVDSIYREGDFSEVVWVFVDDTHNPIHKISITGKFFAPDHRLMAYLTVIDLGTARIDETISQVVQIARSGEVPLGPIQVSSSAKWFNVEIDHGRKTKGRLCLNVTAHIPKGMNEISEEILVQGSDANDFVRIPIRGTVAPTIEVFPNMVLVTLDKEEYNLSLQKYCSQNVVLENHIFEGIGLVLLSCTQDTHNDEHLSIRIKRNQSYTGFASGTLLLQCAGESNPVKVEFVSAPLDGMELRKKGKVLEN